MQRPWQVWLWFALSLAVVVPAMAWLTQQALELDYEVTRSGRDADLEEDISLALWRMDVALAPLVAQEPRGPTLSIAHSWKTRLPIPKAWARRKFRR